MATTIRLTRMGRKQAPFYRIVVVDSRTRRDGSYIDNLGIYNPMPDAYELSVDHDKAVEWLQKGAQPTTTAGSLLRNEGVLYRWHLMKQGESIESIEGKVEEFRSRRSKESEAIRQKSAAKLAAWREDLEKTATDKAKEKQKAADAAKAEADAAVAEEAAADEAPAEGADESAEETTES